MCLPAILVIGLDAPEKLLLEEVADGRYFGVMVLNKYGGVRLARKLQSLGLAREAGFHPKYGSVRWALTFCGCQAGKLLLDLKKNPLLRQPMMDMYNQEILKCSHTRKPPTRPNPEFHWCQCQDF